jgi:acyl-CoA synthetase (AMP-forming)/AMP-acid ligase II
MPCSSPRQDPDLYWQSHQTLMRHIRPAAVVTDQPTRVEMATAGLDLGDSRILFLEDLPGPRLMPVEREESTVAVLQHSSGTTGLKKGVALSFRAIRRQLESYSIAIDLKSDDVIVSWLPLYHDMGLVACLLLPAYFGVEMVHIDPFHWVGHPESLFDQIHARNGTLTWLPNFAFDHLARVVSRKAATWDLSRMRAFISCSEPCKPATFQRFATGFSPAGLRPDQLHCCYAMAETVFAVTQTAIEGPGPTRIRVEASSIEPGERPILSDAEDAVALIDSGVVIQGLRVSIHDESGREIVDGRVGEIAIEGQCLFDGYNGDAITTAARLKDGKYYSRDLGFILHERLYVLGRKDDLIIINGRNLYAHEIETLLNTVKGVKPGRAVSIGFFDSEVGSQALVVLAERDRTVDLSDRAIIRDIVGRLQSVFSVSPKTVKILAEGTLIKTSSGKINRRENFARYSKLENSKID